MAKSKPKNHGKPWRSKREIKLLGTAPDHVVAKKLGRTYRAVQAERKSRAIPAYYPEANYTARDDRWAMRNDLTLRQIAKKIGRSRESVKCRRRRLRAQKQ